MRLADLAPFRNPTAALPRLRTGTTLADLDRALLLLAACYAPALLKLDEEGDGPDNVNDSELQESIDLIRADVNESRYATSWLMKLIALEAAWLADDGATEADRDALVERAGQIVAAEAQIDESEAEAITRTFTFPLDLKQPANADSSETGSRPKIVVNLRDEPLPPSRNDDEPSSSNQHEEDEGEQSARSRLKSYQAAQAVGVQTWAAAAFLADWLLHDITRLHPQLGPTAPAEAPFRTLELGAGTGLVGLALAQYFEQGPQRGSDVHVCMTDFHDQVLANLEHNVASNRTSSPSVGDSPPPTSVQHLDWEEVHHALCVPHDASTTQERWWTAQANSWPSLTAADCVYSPDHARWLAATITYFLRTPDTDPHARAVMIMANRTRGRFGEWELRRSVEDAFTTEAPRLRSGGYRLDILERHALPRVRGLGRDDEDGYIIWVFGFRTISDNAST